METTMRILSLEDLDSILDFERKQIIEEDEFQSKMIEWDARWREEQIRYYVPLGWSFGIWNSQTQQLQSYFLARVIPYFRGYAQVLWVEHFVAGNEQDQNSLLEALYRFGREKHLQSIYIEEKISNQDMVLKYKIQNLDLPLQSIHLGR